MADGVDFMLGCLAGRGVASSASRVSKKSGAVGLTYLAVAFGWVLVWGRFSNRDFSCIVTAAAYVQMMGFLILTVKVHSSKCVTGISSRSLSMCFLFYCTRLSATGMKNGYNPVDSTGDYMYQLIDFASLLLSGHLIYCVHKTYVHSYQEQDDTLPLAPLVIPCLIVGWVAKANFNRHPLFDFFFSASINLDALVMVPQLWMLAKHGGRVETATGHFVAATVVSNIMTFTWWWWCACELEKRGPCLLAKVVIGAQVLKLLLAADFMYYYAEAWIGGTSVVLPTRDSTQEF